MNGLNEVIVPLLMLIARQSLTAEQETAVRELCRRVDDWEAFTRLAVEHQGLPLAYRQLSRLGPDGLPAEALDRMHRLTLLLVAQALRVEAAQRALQTDCLAPLGTRYVVLKGLPLAARYYESTALRPCRDIDVLLEPRDLIPLVLHARRLGYRLHEQPEGWGDWDAAAYCRFANDLSLVSPNGVLIELHKTLDQGQGLFHTRPLLGRSESIAHGGLDIPVLSTADLFVYVCAHHTRHFWSHLHWFGDLDAIVRHPSYDEQAVRRAAEAARLGSTVEACLGLRELALLGDTTGRTARSPRAAELMRLAVECMVLGRDREVQLRDTVKLGNFAFDWQVPAGQEARDRWRQRVARLRPWPADYRAWPLPPHLHGLYYVTRPLRVGWRLLTGRRSSR